jgi:hypothetical protein
MENCGLETSELGLALCLNHCEMVAVLMQTYLLGTDLERETVPRLIGDAGSFSSRSLLALVYLEEDALGGEENVGEVRQGSSVTVESVGPE